MGWIYLPPTDVSPAVKNLVSSFKNVSMGLEQDGGREDRALQGLDELPAPGGRTRHRRHI